MVSAIIYLKSTVLDIEMEGGLIPKIGAIFRTRQNVSLSFFIQYQSMRNHLIIRTNTSNQYTNKLDYN